MSSQAIEGQIQSLVQNPNQIEKTDNSGSGKNLALKELEIVNQQDQKVQIVKGKYKLESLITRGTYGPIYLAKHIQKEYFLIIKFYDAKDKAARKKSFENEENILRMLKSMGFRGFPHLIASGMDDDNLQMRYLAINRFDIDLENLFMKTNKVLQKSTILAIGIQLVSLTLRQFSLQIDRLEKLHGLGYIHNDVKTQNILLSKTTNYLTLADYTMARIINEKQTKSVFKGAPLFTSINVLSGKPALMRDDLESVAYILIYLLCGVLPWINRKNMKISNLTKKQLVEDESDIQRLINLRNPSTLCINLDSEIGQFLTFCQKMPKGKRPDYKYLKNLLIDIRKRDELSENLEWYDEHLKSLQLKAQTQYINQQQIPQTVPQNYLLPQKQSSEQQLNRQNRALSNYRNNLRTQEEGIANQSSGLQGTTNSSVNPIFQNQTGEVNSNANSPTRIKKQRTLKRRLTQKMPDLQEIGAQNNQSNEEQKNGMENIDQNLQEDFNKTLKKKSNPLKRRKTLKKKKTTNLKNADGTQQNVQDDEIQDVSLSPQRAHNEDDSESNQKNLDRNTPRTKKKLEEENNLNHDVILENFNQGFNQGKINDNIDESYSLDLQVDFETTDIDPLENTLDRYEFKSHSNNIKAITQLNRN
eukprot:403364561